MKETVIRFLGKDLKIKSVCDDFVRLEYSEEFRAPGEFSCTLSLDRAYIPAIGEYALIGESALYVIEGVGRDTGAGTARISGRGILSFFSRRILPVTVKNSCPFDSAVYGLAMAYGLSAFPKSLTVKQGSAGESAVIVHEPGNLLSVMTDAVRPFSAGFRTEYDFSAEKFVFSVRTFRDRTLGSGADECVFLSEGFDTAAAVSTDTDLSDYRNYATVRGAQKEDGSYYTVTVSAGAYSFGDSFVDVGQARREIYVKSGIGVGIYTSVNESGAKVFDEAGYLAALRTRGRQELAAHRPKREISAQIMPSAAEGIEVGDICTLFSPASDISAVRVMGKMHVTENGQSVCSARLSI